VNFVAVAEDERGHLGVPEAGLVTEVDTGFQHFAHGNGHIDTPKVVSKTSPLIQRGSKPRQTP
jgi:hypothetical protein